MMDLRKTVWIVAAAGFVVGAQGAARVWDGGGADNNLSTPENWEGDVAPVSGDVLVFQGSVRTSPVNDYDPASVAFAGIVFANASQTCNKPFTLSGNKIVLTGGGSKAAYSGASQDFLIWPVASNASLTETIACDVAIGGTVERKFGSASISNHHLTFTGTVTGNGKSLYSMDQFGGTLTFEGPVKNFTYIQRPNGQGSIWLKSVQNEFSGTAAHTISQGSLIVDSADVFDGATRNVLLGQPAWDTPATLLVNCASDTRLGGTITARGPIFSRVGGIVQNNVAGTTLTLAGELKAATQYTTSPYYTAYSTGLGTTFELGGVGDGVVEAGFATPSTWLRKSGTGTWTIDAGATCSATGDVSVAAGTLVFDADGTAFKKISVSANATLGGTGRVSQVTFAAASKLRLTGAGNRIEPLAIEGTVTLNGTVLVTCDALPDLLPGQEYDVLAFGSCSGVGSFLVGSGLPATAVLSRRADRLVLSFAAAEDIWKGDASNNVWDFSTANWRSGAIFHDGDGVTFDDTADADATDVSISSPVSPARVSVTSSARSYTFRGAGITGVCGVEKQSGTSTLTLANDNDYTGMTTIDAGTFVLSGTLNGSSVQIGPNAVFTNTPTGRIRGNASVSISGPACELAGTNDFTGTLTLRAPWSEATAGVKYIVRTPAALGSGDVELRSGSMSFVGGSGATGLGHTWRVGADGRALVYCGSGRTIKLLGDVLLQMPNSSFYVFPDGVFSFGEPGCTTEVRATQVSSIYVRQNGTVNWYSRVLLGSGTYHQTDGNTSNFHVPGNTWSELVCAVGGAKCYATNALAVAPVKLGQIYENYAFSPWLDLNGYDQTITALIANDVLDKSSQTVKSDAPAVLTVSNDVDSVTLRKQMTIKGALTLRKCGAGDWTFGARNKTTGDVIVESGTFVVAADDALPTGSETSALVVKPGAHVVLSNGVNATVSCLTSGGDWKYPAGVYGGAGCTAQGARILPNCFGAGMGSLRVLHGGGGTAVIFR